jgi:hypothetical protein
VFAFFVVREDNAVVGKWHHQLGIDAAGERWRGLQRQELKGDEAQGWEFEVHADLT